MTPTFERRLRSLASPLFALALMGIAVPVRAQERTVVTTAAEAGGFETLIAAAKAAGLDGALSEAGPFTVFAPTNAAFAKLPEGTLEALLEEPERLRGILTYHVVSGRKTASEVVGVSELETLNGAVLRVTRNGEAVELGGARILQTDIEAGNGVIHVIDAVMLPPTE